MEPDPEPSPDDPRRSVYRMLTAIVVGIAAILVLLFTVCGAIFAFAGLTGGAAGDGLTLFALGCAVVGGAAFYGLVMLHRRL